MNKHGLPQTKSLLKCKSFHLREKKFNQQMLLHCLKKFKATNRQFYRLLAMDFYRRADYWNKTASEIKTLEQICG